MGAAVSGTMQNLSVLLAIALSASHALGCSVEDPAADPDDGAGSGGGKDDIWGPDERQERYEYPPGPIRDAAHSSAAIVAKHLLVLDPARGTWSAAQPQTLQAKHHLCNGQRFATQPTVASCSATLITADIMITAGHCFNGDSTLSVLDLVVFDLAYDVAPSDPMLIAKSIPDANVYRVAEVLDSKYNITYADDGSSAGQDYAVVRLDRAVTGRTPARVNWSAAIALGTTFVIGHPSGIPQKISRGKILDIMSSTDFIGHDVDTLPGNSGGGMFDTRGTLIGIHTTGSVGSYVPNPAGGSCNIVGTCGDIVTCTRSNEAYDTRALKLQLSPELRARLGTDR
jgi:hypothetical protein